MVTTGAVVQSFGARKTRIFRDLTVQELKLSLQKQACLNKLRLQKQIFASLKFPDKVDQLLINCSLFRGIVKAMESVGC